MNVAFLPTTGFQRQFSNPFCSPLPCDRLLTFLLDKYIERVSRRMVKDASFSRFFLYYNHSTKCSCELRTTFLQCNLSYVALVLSQNFQVIPSHKFLSLLEIQET